MCSVDAHDKNHSPITDGASSGGLRKMTITSAKESIFSLGYTINFIDNWLQ